MKGNKVFAEDSIDDLLKLKDEDTISKLMISPILKG